MNCDSPWYVGAQLPDEERPHAGCLGNPTSARPLLAVVRDEVAWRAGEFLAPFSSRRHGRRGVIYVED
jgi:hypothetical protein